MSSNNNSILDGNGNGDDKEGNGNALAQKQQQQQKQQPVVSLLEKYSNLHRGIDQARKQYTERQVEIESIESEIEKIVEHDRPATNEAIETAIVEKTLLLQNLSKLSANLAEAQRIEMSAKSSLELTKLKELNAIEASTSDQRKFFTACKCFRNQVTTLSLRSECFGLTSSVATPLDAYATLRICGRASYKQKHAEKGSDDANDDERFRSINHSFLAASIGLIENSKNSNSDEPAEENDDEIQDLLRQLKEQQKRNSDSRKVLEEEKTKQSSLQLADDKRDSQKKDLQSQYERLQQNIRDAQSQIENLKQQTEEAQKMTKEFQNGK